MSVDQRLADLAGILSRRTTERLLALQRVQELGRFLLGLMDSTPGSWIDAAVRTGDVGPWVDTWRRLVDEIYLDAVAIGDRELRRRVDLLSQWRQRLTTLLASETTKPQEATDETASSSSPVDLPTVINDIGERLEVLVRRSRRTTAGIVAGAFITAVVLAFTLGS